MTEQQADEEYTKYVAWRLERLVANGMNVDTAQVLADRIDLSLREILDMVDNGCPQNLLLRILL